MSIPRRKTGLSNKQVIALLITGVVLYTAFPWVIVFFVL